MEVHFEDLKEEDLREVYDLCMETFQESFAFEEIEETFQLCRNDVHYRFLVGKSQGKVVAYTSINIFHNLFDGRRPIMTLWYVCVSKEVRRKGVGTSAVPGRSKRSRRENDCEIIYFTLFAGKYRGAEFLSVAGLYR